eukprot:5558500-Alexandrium_andersonii.AAC.1
MASRASIGSPKELGVLSGALSLPGRRPKGLRHSASPCCSARFAAPRSARSGSVGSCKTVEGN